MTIREIKKVKCGECLTTKYGDILLVQRVDVKPSIMRFTYNVKVFYFFSLTKDGLDMNEWLLGFYGEKFEEDFYRPSTENEKALLFDKMEKRGYRWDCVLKQPIITFEECSRILSL